MVSLCMTDYCFSELQPVVYNSFNEWMREYFGVLTSVHSIPNLLVCYKSELILIDF